MPAKSIAQQHMMGMVDAEKEGEFHTKNKSLRNKVKKIANGISSKAAGEFAHTKTKGLPKHVTSESKKTTFTQFLKERTIEGDEAPTNELPARQQQQRRVPQSHPAQNRLESLVRNWQEKAAEFKKGDEIHQAMANALLFAADQLKLALNKQ